MYCEIFSKKISYPSVIAGPPRGGGSVRGRGSRNRRRAPLHHVAGSGDHNKAGANKWQALHFRATGKGRRAERPLLASRVRTLRCCGIRSINRSPPGVGIMSKRVASRYLPMVAIVPNRGGFRGNWEGRRDCRRIAYWQFKPTNHDPTFLTV